MGNSCCQKLLTISTAVLITVSLCDGRDLDLSEISIPEKQPKTVSVRTGENATFTCSTTCTRGCETFALWNVQIYSRNYTVTFNGIYDHTGIIQWDGIAAELTMANSINMANCSYSVTDDYSLLLINVSREEHHQAIITCGLLLHCGYQYRPVTRYNGDSFRLLVDEDCYVNTPICPSSATEPEGVVEISAVVSLVLLVMVILTYFCCRRQKNQDAVSGKANAIDPYRFPKSNPWPNYMPDLADMYTDGTDSGLQVQSHDSASIAEDSLQWAHGHKGSIQDITNEDYYEKFVPESDFGSVG